MIKGLTNRWDEFAVLVDTGAAFLAYLTVIHLYMHYINPPVETVQLVTSYFSYSMVILGLSWIVFKLNFRGYSRRWNQLPMEMAMILISNVELSLSLAFIIFILKATWFSRLIFLMLPTVTVIYQTILHGVIKVSLGKFRLRGRDQKVLAVLGQPKRVKIFTETVDAIPEAGMRVSSAYPFELGNKTAAEKALHELRSLLAMTVVDTIVIALPVADEIWLEALAIARSQGKEIRLILDEIGALAHKSHLYDFYGNSVLVVDSSRSHKTSRHIVKRLVDILGAGAAMVMLSPLMLSIAMLIKWEDPRAPVLFVQDRVGLNGRQFPCLKFRTMVPNAEQLKKDLVHLNVMSGPVFKIPDDPRVTRMGRFLRKTSLDELPQVFNVFWGQMSLVGPRPALPSEVAQYGDSYRKRLSVRPGLTCLWQISGRSNIDFSEWMRLDMEYIDSWSLLLDLKIIAKTIPAVIQQRGAH